ncbi:MAG TPA: hypothetical protein PLL65_21000 [Phycisphaerae bacterium]|nr:hypothetical protein [Phycisphaerae bacterium]HOM53796.1 hypothetical protein [Phycisphaerae bacterium]
MFGLKVDIDDAEAKSLFFRALAQTSDLTPVFRRLGLFMRRAAGERLKRRGSEDATGKLRASIAYEAGPQQLLIGSNLRYAAVQQFGHPGITPKTVKALAIPLLPHIKRRGIWPRDWNDEADGALFLWPPKSQRREHGGKVWLARRLKRGKTVTLQLVYRLVAAARIPRRPYLVFDPAARQFLRDQLAEFVRKVRSGK